MFQLSTDVHAGIVRGINTGENVERTMQRRDFEEAAEALRRLLMGLRETEMKAEKMKDAAANLDRLINEILESNSELKKDAKKLEKRVEGLECKVDKLMIMKSNLETWHTACDFENLLAKHIYPQDAPVTFGPIFANLMLWLHENKNTSEGQEASKKWDEFKRQVSWSDEHEKVFYEMLKCKMAIRYQGVDFRANFSDADMQYLEEIRQMCKQLEQSNR